mmetsp:Transcript_35197/g.101092  ORF Transcript_35197/g.101092 Transcript_35197/m.101092 type:complete len:88 (+) Transcript_35197:695-958(+)
MPRVHLMCGLSQGFSGLSFKSSGSPSEPLLDEVSDPTSSCKASSSAAMSMRGVDSDDFVLGVLEDDEDDFLAYDILDEVREDEDDDE